MPIKVLNPNDRFVCHDCARGSGAKWSFSGNYSPIYGVCHYCDNVGVKIPLRNFIGLTPEILSKGAKKKNKKPVNEETLG